MTDADQGGRDLARIDAFDEDGLVVQEVLREADARLGDIRRIADAVEESHRKANTAQDAAREARDKSAGLFKKKAAIEALQSAGMAASEALDSLAECQRSLFENQQTLANYVRELTGFALSSVTNTRIVYRHLKEQLTGASQGELSELAERELRSVMQEFKRQLDLVERQEETDRKLMHLRAEITHQKTVAEQAMADAADQHGLFHQAAALAESNAARLDAVLEEVELQRLTDISFNESMQVVNRRLDDVELVSGNAASGLATEVVHGQQRDESISQLFALAAAYQETAAAERHSLEKVTRSSSDLMHRMRRQLRLATVVSVTGLTLASVAIMIFVLASI